MERWGSIAVKLPFIGREKECRVITQAITGTGPRIIYIRGDAGIGKTRLLEEVERIVEGLGEQVTNVICLPIIDFYNTAIHSGSAIEEAVVRNLAERGIKNHAFQEFGDKLVSFREGRVSEEDLWQVFKRGYDEVCQDTRIVLRFDTAELLEYERDEPEVLEDCEVEELMLEVPALGWLAEKALQLQNTAILIASRPSEGLYKRFKDVYGENLQSLKLESLNLMETEEYFRQAGDFGRRVFERSPEIVEKIWLLSDGRPILISLALDWLQRGIWDVRLCPIGVAELREMHEQDGEELKHRFGMALVQKIHELNTPLDKAIYYAARTRKGCNIALLARMMEISKEEAKDLVPQLLKLSFVKQPHILPKWRKQQFFLHDEMYDLVEKYVWQIFWPDYVEQERIAERIIDYYDEEIEQVEQAIRGAKTERERSDLQHQRHILMTERLYYQFDLDPQKGQLEYDRLDTQACSERALEWDRFLRTEAIHFARQRVQRALRGGLVTIHDGKVRIADWINMNCRARWIHRFLARGEFAKAEHVARHLIDLHLDWGGLWKARILVGQGAAMVRMGQPESTAVLQEALDILGQLELEEDPWMIRHYIATAYLHLGLRARAEWDMKRAAEMNGKARKFFEDNDEPIGAARASNNLAYVWARQGKYAEAMRVAQEAADIRRKLGDMVGLGLSLNTLAIVEDMTGIYARARAHAREALSVLQRARQMGRPGLDREIAMVYLNLGRIRRHLVERHLLITEESAERLWSQAKSYLQEAKKRKDALEPYYRSGLYNQLGLLYERWANWVALRTPRQKERYHSLMRQANEFHKEADEFNKKERLLINRADNLEDWAWVFHLRRAYCDAMGDELEPAALEQKMLERLQEAEDLIKDKADPEKEGLQAHYIAGSVHHQWGRFVHKFKDDIEAALQHYALSVAYYDQYSFEPLERRERVLEHIENALAGLSAVQAKGVAEEMLRAVEERGLPARELRRLIQER